MKSSDRPSSLLGHPGRWGRRLLLTALIIAVVAIVAAVAGWAGYRHLGRTPGELMDYIERRLEGHPRIEAVALPVLAGLRQRFDAASATERTRTPFVVPPPPPRLGPDELAVPEPPPAGARVWRVSPKGPINRISEVSRLARPGDVVEIEAGEYRQDVAVWEQSRLTIRGINGSARLFADGRSAEGKAIWVIRRGEFDISNIDFIGAQVGDGNGAGIRFEGGHLRVRNCLFWGNQMGLLTGGNETAADATLSIEGSEFAYSHVRGKWGHNLYVGTIASLTVTSSYFHHAGVGHLLKSRARVNDIRHNRLSDESGGRASYEMDFPNGGVVRLIGNVVQQQRYAEHSTLIAYGMEGYKWPLNTLEMANNTLVNDHPYGGTFLRVASGADHVESSNNLLVGPGSYRVEAPLNVFNDVNADWEAFVRPSRHDYRLSQPTTRLAYRPHANPASGSSRPPQAEYVHLRRIRPLPDGPQYVGAIQDKGG